MIRFLGGLYVRMFPINGVMVTDTDKDQHPDGVIAAKCGAGQW
jgi:hypothetical protein